MAVTELQAGLTGLLAKRDFWGAELGLGWRPKGQTRFAVTLAAGDADGARAVRLCAAVQFVLLPGARSGTSPYAGLGLAFLGASGVRGAGYETAMLGIEAAPGQRHGWYAEVGLGGGVRAAAGLRWRRFPASW